jgi:hypothetical protein
MPSYIRPVEQWGLEALLALMKSALLLLIKSAASEAVSQSRVWRSRSDLSCHQFSCALCRMVFATYQQLAAYAMPCTLYS